MTSQLFDSDAYLELQLRTRDVLNAQEDFLSSTTAGSPRAVGDSVQAVLAENFDAILGPFCSEYSTDFARRAMADLAFTDPEGFYYVVDVKTHRTDTRFNMPNLTSVERLARFYQDDHNYFVLLIVSYTIEGTRLLVEDVKFVPVEFLQWDCLTIGALGWGQIQIANSNYINILPGYSRKSWMLELCDNVLEFYPAEIAKINERIGRFQHLRLFWEAK